MGFIKFGSRVDLYLPLDAKLKVKIGDITTDWLPWLTHRASNDTSWWAPEVGEQVIVLAPSGELHQAVIMPSIYQSAHPAIDNNHSQEPVRSIEYYCVRTPITNNAVGWPDTHLHRYTRRGTLGAA